MKMHYTHMRKIGEMQLRQKLIRQEKFKIDGLVYQIKNGIKNWT